MGKDKIRVSLVSCSSEIEKIFSKIVKNNSSFSFECRKNYGIQLDECLKDLLPDVYVIDLWNNKKEGFSFVKKLMHTQPIPCVILSSLDKGSKEYVKLLFLGVHGFLYSKQEDIKFYLKNESASILNTIATAAKHKKKISFLKPLVIEEKESPDTILKLKERKTSMKTETIIFIGASTGGIQALEELLKDLPVTTPGILIVQHMPKSFTQSFAQRLDSICNMSVKESEGGEEVKRGQIFLAPGDKHLLVKRENDKYFTLLKDGSKVSRHKPSVDVLFRSAANEAGSNAIGVILTGMGDDGAIGMKEMKDSGAKTIAQNEESCVVYGMPKEAVRLGGVKEILELHEISKNLFN